MLGLNPTTLLGALVGALALFGAGLWTGHEITSNAWQAEMAAQELALRERYVAEAEEANARADEAERKIEAIRAGTRVVTRYVDRLVERPGYRNVCLDPDGLRAVNAALTGAPAGPGLAGPALPGPDAAGGRDGGGGAAEAR